MGAVPCKLLSLPDEILTMILSFTMASEEPCHKRFSSGFRFPDPSRLDLLTDDQKQHYLDWIFISGTCQSTRRVGKPAFFCEKIFDVNAKLEDHLRGNKVNNMTASDVALAKACIRHVLGVPWQSIEESFEFTFFDYLQSISAYETRRNLGGDGRPRHDRELVLLWGFK
ncbi:MAG: hypothetical protein Q9226_004352 [Calogaya cf. arnoldii]